MPYQLAQKYLEDHLRPALLDDPSHSWLDAVHTSYAGQHLGTNLAIDLAGGALELATVVMIISTAVSAHSSFPDGDSACNAFAATLVSYRYGHRLGPCSTATTDQYARATKLSVALRFYFQGTGLDFNFAGLQELETIMTQASPFAILEGRPLKGGGHGTVWVTTRQAVRDIVRANPTNPSLAVRLALGLGGLHVSGALNPAKLLMLYYPESFNSATYQPTVCDSSCLPGPDAFPYLSAKTADRWGRTIAGAPERIHKPVDDFPWSEAEGEVLDGEANPRPVPIES